MSKLKKGITDPASALALKYDIIKLMRDPRLSKVNFRIDSYAVNQKMFQTVGQAVSDGKIKVVFDRKMTDHAEYDFRTNSIHYGRASLDSKVFRATIVHEAAHAAWDIVYKKKIKVTSSEAASYLAQITWFTLEWNGVEPFLNSPKGGDNAKVFQIARELAQKVLKGQSLGPGDQSRLKSAVRLHSNYKNLPANATYAYDGV